MTEINDIKLHIKSSGGLSPLNKNFDANPPLGPLANYTNNNDLNNNINNNSHEKKTHFKNVDFLTMPNSSASLSSSLSSSTTTHSSNKNNSKELNPIAKLKYTSHSNSELEYHQSISNDAYDSPVKENILSNSSNQQQKSKSLSKKQLKQQSSLSLSTSKSSNWSKLKSRLVFFLH